LTLDAGAFDVGFAEIGGLPWTTIEKTTDTGSDNFISGNFLVPQKNPGKTGVFLSDAMEAEGIEPSSQDNQNDGLYMLIWCFKSQTLGPTPTSSFGFQTSLSRQMTNVRVIQPACYFSAAASQATQRTEVANN